MSQAAKVQEPSMEEILASIRRIISDEETPPKPSAPKHEAVAQAPAKPAIVPAPAAKPAPAAAQVATAPAPRGGDIGKEFDAIFDQAAATADAETTDADILDLTEDMQADEVEDVEMPEPPVFRSIDGRADVVFAEQEAEVTAFPGAFSSAPAMPVSDPLPAPAFARAAQTGTASGVGSPLLSPTASASVDSAFHSLAQAVMVQNGRTLEDIVCDLMRPMLKAWLDDNLPGLVERMVRAEIERVSRGRP